MDVQVVLLIILSLLTINLVVVGIYVVIVLKEFRETIKKMNNVLDTMSEVAVSVSGPIKSISSLAAGLSSGLRVLNVFKSLTKKRKEDE